MSLPGSPPLPWFHAQLETSIGSFDPPPVKVVPLFAGCDANSTAVAPLVVPLKTRSQSSGAPVPEWLVMALPSSSNAPVAFTASAGIASSTAAATTKMVVSAAELRRRDEVTSLFKALLQFRG